jgi:hypothetical protein
MFALTRIELADSCVTKVAWSPRINQIITANHDTSLKVLYNPSISTRGATMCLKTHTRRMLDFDIGLLGLELGVDEDDYIEDASITWRKKKPKFERYPDKRMPEVRGNRIGFFTPGQADKREDPREALLKYAKDAQGISP